MMESQCPWLADELRVRLSEVDRADVVRQILERLSRRIGGLAVLVDPDGTVTPADRKLTSAVVADVRSVSGGEIDGLSSSLDGHAACILPISRQPPRPVLVIWTNPSGRRLSAAERGLLADASVRLEGAWREREGWRQAARADRAARRCREAALYLLSAGDTAGAQRVAGALGERLPDRIRVHLVDAPARRLDDTVRWCAGAGDGTAWVVRCPVHTTLTVVVARAEDDALTEELRARAGADPSCCVGSSQQAPLTNFAATYQHAFHALAVARHKPERYAAFRANGELSDILATVGSGWAARTLAPLHEFRPARPHDPDARQLLVTLMSWLIFHNRATRHLGVHRNTLAARLHLIESVLGVDLRDVAAQARLHLATHLTEPPGEANATLGQLLSLPEPRFWADKQLAPFHASDPRLLETLRAWLSHQARIADAARTLSVSQSTVRKRLIRMEQLINRSLLDSPSARYDLCLALACRDLHDEPAERPERRPSVTLA